MNRISLALAIVMVLGGVAHASGPGFQPRYEDYQVCKKGPAAGLDCMSDSDCLDSECVIDWVKGRGTTLNGTLTVFYDDRVRDFKAGVDTSYQALNMMLEVRVKGQKHLFVETYMDATDPTKQPQVLGWNPVLNEELLSSFASCTSFLYTAAETKTADALRALAGLPATKTPVIGVVKEKTESFPHYAVGDDLGSAIRCKVKIRFFNEP